MTDTTEKLRAVFLAAIMVLSVVAMTASFSGAVAAQNSSIDQGVSDISIDDGDRTIIDENVDGVLQSDNIAPVTQTVDVELTAENGVFDESNDFTINIQDSLESGVSVSYVSGSDSGTGFASGVNSVSVTESDGDAVLNVDWAGSVSDADNGTTATVTFDVTLDTGVTASNWATIDEDVDFDGTSSIDHVASDEFDNSESTSYRAVEVGTSAASQSSTTADRDTSTIVDSFNPSSGDEYLRVYEGETLTVDANNDREVIKLREFTQGEASSDPISLGDTVSSTGTTPGQAANLDTSGVDSGLHVIQYGDDSSSLTVVDIQPLGLSTEFADSEINLNQDATVNVDTDDLTGSSVTAFLFEDAVDFTNDSPIATATANLNGSGQAAIDFASGDGEAIPDDGDYQVAIRHDPSAVFAVTGTLQVGDALDTGATINTPTTADEYVRGDIVPIEIDLTGGADTATLTFGDSGTGQNVEVNATVVDEDGDGTATVYLNTFQIGTPERDHGIVTGENTGLQGAVTNTTDAALGGATDASDSSTSGGAVIAAGSYDLTVVTGDQTYEQANRLDARTKVRLNERNTESFQQWTAPGSVADDLETVDDISEAVEDNLVTPADGTVADGDLFVLEMESSGLEGLLHEALVTDGEGSFGNADQGDFFSAAETLLFDREDDHDVSTAFDAASQVAARQNAPEHPSLVNTGITPLLVQLFVAGDSDVNTAGSGAVLETSPDTVLAGTDEDGNLDTFYLVMDDTGSNFETETEYTALYQVQTMTEETSLGTNTDFIAGEYEYIVDDNGDNTQVFDPTEGTTSGFTFQEAAATIDFEGDEVSVPQENNVEISGTTTLAAGTELGLDLVTASGEDDAFVKTPTTTVEYVEGGDNTWSVTLDFSNETAGTEFDISVTRTDSSTILTANEETVPGVVTAPPAVDEFTFEDQDSPGASVVVDTFNTTQGGFIAIENADGERLGTSSMLGTGEQTRIAVSLDEDLEENQELTAVAYRAEGAPYTDDNGDAITRTAMVTVEDTEPADFVVSDLAPQNAELDEPGAVIEVSATITNEGGEEATQDVELRIDGQTLDTQSVTLAGGDSTTVTFEADTSALEFGTTYIHSIASEDGDAASKLTIGPEPTPEPTPTATPEPTPTATPEPTPTETATDTPDETATSTPEDSDGDGAGFGVVVALLAFLGAALLAVRRQTRE
ncbi:DUF7282 domain-containing protein [Halovenus aranensis]|nr:BGTF surface domain-containing protein [Halovenus aranensis]